MEVMAVCHGKTRTWKPIKSKKVIPCNKPDNTICQANHFYNNDSGLYEISRCEAGNWPAVDQDGNETCVKVQDNIVEKQDKSWERGFWHSVTAENKGITGIPCDFQPSKYGVLFDNFEKDMWRTRVYRISGNPDLKTLPVYSLKGAIFDELYLNDNGFEGFARETFVENLGKEAQEYLKIDLSGNSLVSSGLDDDLFQKFIRLENYNFSNNKLSELKPNWFNKRSKNINIANNEIDSVAADYFKGFQNLESLDMSNNKISGLDKVMFQSTWALKNINLSGNSIKNVIPNQFCCGFSHIDLSNNLIDNVDIGSFSHGYQLAEVKLDGNNCTPQFCDDGLVPDTDPYNKYKYPAKSCFCGDNEDNWTPKEVKVHSKTTYRYLPGRFSWSEAWEACENIGFKLATVRNMNELTKFTKIIDDELGYHPKKREILELGKVFWTSGKSDSNGKFYWTNSEDKSINENDALHFKKWLVHPSRANGANLNACLKLEYENLDWHRNEMSETNNWAAFTWDDCNVARMPAICEYKQSEPNEADLLADGWTKVPTDDVNTKALFWKMRDNPTYYDLGFWSSHCKKHFGQDSMLLELRTQAEYDFLRQWQPILDNDKSIVISGKNEWVYGDDGFKSHKKWFWEGGRPVNEEWITPKWGGCLVFGPDVDWKLSQRDCGAPGYPLGQDSGCEIRWEV